MLFVCQEERRDLVRTVTRDRAAGKPEGPGGAKMKQDQFRDSLMRHQQDNVALEPGTVRIIVIGGSAGSLCALRAIINELPAGFGAAIFVVEHVSADASCNLAHLLSHDGALPVKYAIDQEPIAPGTIYVAPPDEHMVLDRGRVRLQRSPKEPWNRPSTPTPAKSPPSSSSRSWAMQAAFPRRPVTFMV